MMIIARGIAGFGAGGEYPVCGTNAAEASDETPALRTKRGFLVALTTDFAIDLVRGSISCPPNHLFYGCRGANFCTR